MELQTDKNQTKHGEHNGNKMTTVREKTKIQKLKLGTEFDDKHKFRIYIYMYTESPGHTECKQDSGKQHWFQIQGS